MICSWSKTYKLNGQAGWKFEKKPCRTVAYFHCKFLVNMQHCYAWLILTNDMKNMYTVKLCFFLFFCFLCNIEYIQWRHDLMSRRNDLLIIEKDTDSVDKQGGGSVTACIAWEQTHQYTVYWCCNNYERSRLNS